MVRQRWLFRKVLDGSDPGSLSTRLRRRRFAFFGALLDRVAKPIRILDVGGTPTFWQMMESSERRDLEITLLNLFDIERPPPQFHCVVGDARDLTRFADREFDVVFSNSVIEHVGNYGDQQKMAESVRRVGKRYFVQTPNKYFPIEPHFFVPLFQFLPIGARAWLLNHFDLGWYKRMPDYQAAKREVEAVRLLTERELMRLFPDGILYRERFFGFVKSLTVYHGWDMPQ